MASLSNRITWSWIPKGISTFLNSAEGFRSFYIKGSRSPSVERSDYAYEPSDSDGRRAPASRRCGIHRAPQRSAGRDVQIRCPLFSVRSVLAQAAGKHENRHAHG